jgi:ribosome-associated protein
MPTFKIQGDTIELIKLLKITGLCSTGGMAKIAAAQGLVKVDNQTELRKRCKIRKGQVVEFEGNVIKVV